MAHFVRHQNTVAVHKRESTSWRDAQPQFMAIARRALLQLAQRAGAAMEATAAATAVATVRPTRRAAEAATAAAVPPGAAVQGRDGRAPVRLSRTRLLRWRRSRRYARLLRLKRRQSQIFEIASFVTPGMIGWDPPSNCTIC